MLKNSIVAFAVALIWWLTGVPMTMPGDLGMVFKKGSADDRQ